MKIPYLIGTAATPQVSLGGSLQRPRPIMSVRITGPTHFAVRDALLDTGADDTVFFEGIAPVIGVDLTRCSQHNMHLAGRGWVPCRFAQVLLRITDYVETFEWNAMVAFIPLRLKCPLLGYAGFLQYFDSNFRGADREVILTPNWLFSGQRI